MYIYIYIYYITGNMNNELTPSRKNNTKLSRYYISFRINVLDQRIV